MSTQLNNRILKLKTIFNFEKVLSRRTDITSIARYYKINNIPYSLFHNRENFIHMSISRNGKFKKEDLLEQVKIVEKYINVKTEKVLELGTGRGANCIYLAKKYLNIDFVGLDLPNGQLQHATKKAKELKNFKLQEGDFHDLNKYPEKSLDIVFIIEALCHSNQKQKVIKEVKRILKKDGIFIVIDAFTNKKELSAEELLAKQLVEKSMTVANFDNYKEFRELLNRNDFEIIFEEDDSLEIMPSLNRFEKDANILLSLPQFIAKLIIKFFPSEFTFNAIAGYLMPELIESGVARYMVIVSRKRS